MGSIRGEGGAGGGGGGGLADLVDDTTPQLGGNLDVNGFNVGGATPTQLGYLAATTAAGAALLDDANAAAQLATLGAVGAAAPVLTGTVVVRQTGGVAGTDEIQVSHDGANGKIESKEGSIFLKGESFFPFRSEEVLLASVDSSGGLFAYRFWITGFDVWLERVSSGRARIGGGIDGHGILDASSFESKVATGTAPLTVASTTVVTNLNADKLDGKDAVDFAPCTQATLTAGASVALDFAAAGLATLTTDQNTTITTSNRAAGRQPYNLRIIGGGAHTLTFPAGWKWLNSTMPAAIASGKTGRLCLECYGSADTDVVASFAVEA